MIDINRETKHRGVTRTKSGKRWSAYLDHNGRRKHLGAFSTQDAAIAARESAFVKANAPRYKSRYKGVIWSVRAQKWEANMRSGGHKRYLGVFDTEEEAAAAFKASLPPGHTLRAFGGEMLSDEAAAGAQTEAVKRSQDTPAVKDAPLDIVHFVHGYIPLALGRRLAHDRWTPLVARWLDHALEQEPNPYEELMRKVLACIRAERASCFTSYAHRLEAALDALFVAAMCDPLFAREIDDE